LAGDCSTVIVVVKSFMETSLSSGRRSTRAKSYIARK